MSRQLNSYSALLRTYCLMMQPLQILDHGYCNVRCGPSSRGWFNLTPSIVYLCY
uniref:Uncharacterized protein n=1 Tax=Arundo donax TaxID=35708 RepID=A0A0A9GJJ3_ARUDO